MAGLLHDLAPVAGAAGTQLRNAVPDDCVVYADAEVLRRVLQNLIANAIDHSPGAEVVIEARAIDESGAVECIVRDNGSGIPAERLQAVFEKYESEAGKEGSGLGLAIVRTFVEAHGGVVAAESELGVGSVFRFTLPARQA